MEREIKGEGVSRDWREEWRRVGGDRFKRRSAVGADRSEDR